MAATISDTIGGSAASPSASAAGFAYAVHLTDTVNLGSVADAGLVSDLNAALAEWAQYITGAGTLTVQLTIAPTTRENGGATTSYHVGADAGRELYMPSSIYELTTGQHVAGSSSDITITVDPGYLAQYVWIDPNPDQPSTIPADRQDQVSVFLHELGHGLGISSFRDASGHLGSAEFLWDTFLVQQGPDSVWFEGPHAMDVYGGPLPVTTLHNGEAYSHLANTTTEPLGADVMNGVALYGGRSYAVSNVDLAILQDLGVPVTSHVGTPAQPTVSIAATAANLAEGQSGTTPFVFTVQRSGDTSAALSVSWSVTSWGDHPADGTDFAASVLPTGVVNFAAGETSRTISVAIAGDTTVEADEGFAVTIATGGANVLPSIATAVGLVLNDDAAVTGASVLSITGTAGGQAVRDTATLAPFAHVTIADTAPGQAITLTVTMSAAANGSLSNLAGGRYDPVVGAYTVTGSAGVVSGALDGLVFTPAARQTGLGQAITTGFVISASDQLGTLSLDTATSIVATAAHTSNVTIYAGGTEVRDSLDGSLLQTLPPIATDALRFLAVDGREYAQNLPSARVLGLDPSQLRDYDGNDLGAANGWAFRGLASVRAATAVSYILVNPVNGRWAEVAARPGGGFDFTNHGQDGDTRVVGIYEDPLIKLGQVVAGSAVDSQVRFLSDIRADRLTVLGAADYDNNGFVDLFFKLTNHSPDHHDDVYLRAIMHLDGNIQYANYMTTGQFVDWMGKAGTPSAVYDSWLTKA